MTSTPSPLRDAPRPRADPARAAVRGHPATSRTRASRTCPTSPLAHRALRSGTRLLADSVTAIAAGAPCDDERRDAVVWFAEHVLREIAEHHRKEDDILWPVIAASVPAGVDLAGLSDVHGVLDAVLLRTHDALRTFATPGVQEAGALAAALTELADDLDAHIAQEEAAVFPVIREFVSEPDLARCRALFARHHPWSHAALRRRVARGARPTRPSSPRCGVPCAPASAGRGATHAVAAAPRPRRAVAATARRCRARRRDVAQLAIRA